MMRRFIALGIFLGALSGLFAQSRVYISPNNDGVQDTLRVPFSITDRRYVTEWSFVITDSAGAPVRTIGNKDKRPAKMTFKTFFKLLFTPKQGVAVPQSVAWDGTSDRGETVQDGDYLYYFTAADDNGNRSQSESFPVTVDNTPPEITLSQPPEADKFFGAGAKSRLAIVQSGSVEDLWRGVITDTRGDGVNIFHWENSSPASFSWDGKSGTLIPVPDGVYTYSIESTDRAGNKSSSARIGNIVYSGERPVTGIAISGSPWFSPGPDSASPQKTVTFDLTIPAPSGGNTLTLWQVAITGSDGTVRRTFAGDSSRPPPARIPFDGTGDSGQLLPEGAYRAVVTAAYLNGFEAGPVRSPAFFLDTTPPAATVRPERTIFSPAGNSSLNTMPIRQETSTENAWFAEIRSSTDAVVRRFDLGPKPDDTVLWNGTNDTGALCPDGNYTYRLYCTDLAGNFAQAVSAPFELNTGDTELILTAQPVAFSPNGDGVQDSVTFTPVVKAAGGIDTYTLTITDGAGTVVRTFTGTASMPAGIPWNGRSQDGAALPDGTYTASLYAKSRNGTETTVAAPVVTLDTVPPQVTASAAWTVFSPDGDTRKDTLPMDISTSREQRWTAVITGTSGVNSGKQIRQWTWRDTALPLTPPFEWDGTDEAGNVAADGTYSFTIRAQDEAGNRGEIQIPGIILDARPVRAWITAQREVFSSAAPQASDRTQLLTLSVTPADGINLWVLEILPMGVPEAQDAKGGADSSPLAPNVPIRVWRGTSPPPESIPWDGKDDRGNSAEGRFAAVLSMEWAKGSQIRVESAPFLCTSVPPVLGVKIEPLYFSPDNDGVDDDLFIGLSAKSLLPFASWSFEIRDPEGKRPFWRIGGTSGITGQTLWDGRSNVGASADFVESATDYPYAFTVTDTLGLTSSVSGVIPVDVLVIRVGDVLKIRVPSIIFRPNAAVLDQEGPGLTAEQVANNMRVLRRIAETLNKFRDYTVIIEGHSNNVSGPGESVENIQAGIVLSGQRAAAVRSQLMKFGVNGQRLTTAGKGDQEPIAAFGDRDNWWKNRRVEFILNK
ncbi:MAG: OmpA family protein [Spirochaetaceae bacterium]|jgi:flagellar hook assembly protein FlgD|nr:OmpA family protein [Spirochaetaceae bacterium]